MIVKPCYLLELLERPYWTDYSPARMIVFKLITSKARSHLNISLNILGWMINTALCMFSISTWPSPLLSGWTWSRWRWNTTWCPRWEMPAHHISSAALCPAGPGLRSQHLQLLLHLHICLRGRTEGDRVGCSWLNMILCGGVRGGTESLPDGQLEPAGHRHRADVAGGDRAGGDWGTDLHTYRPHCYQGHPGPQDCKGPQTPQGNMSLLQFRESYYLTFSR